MHKTLLALTLIPSVLVSTTYAEDLKLRPGLWEITTTSDLLRLVPHISPDQMQGLKDMAKQYGLEMPKIQNGAATSQVCITQEMADRKELPELSPNQAGCSTKNASRTGNNYKLEYSCAHPQLNGNGTAEGVLTSPERFTAHTSFAGTAQGNPVNEKAEIKGQWMDANCGAIKSAQ